MKLFKLLTFVLLSALGTSPLVAQYSETATELTRNIALYGRIQIMGIGQVVPDRVQSDYRIYLFLKQARLGVRSTVDDVRLDFQAAFGGEEIVVAPSPGISLQLLDFSIDFPVVSSLRLKAGQFKVPYGREGITNGGHLLFADRSVQYNAFFVGRDVGLALYGTSEKLTGALGVFTGGGRDVPIRYLPERFGIPMIVARVGYNNDYDEDILTAKQTDGTAKNGWAVYANGFYMKDFLVGHSTVLNVKTGTDKSLLLDAAWNPYIAKRPFSQGEFYQLGVDAALRTTLSNGWLAFGEAELNNGGYKNKYGSLSVTGGRVQGGVAVNPFEVALRYAFIKPDPKFAYVASSGTSYKIIDNKLIHELTFGVSYYIRPHVLKLTADLPILIQVPVVTDNSGAYVLTQQQAQVSYIANPGAKIERRNIAQGRMQLQYIF